MVYSDNYIESLQEAMLKFWLFFLKSNLQSDELVKECIELLRKDDNNV